MPAKTKRQTGRTQPRAAPKSSETRTKPRRVPTSGKGVDPASARYTPAEIEPRWQAKWEADGLYRAEIDLSRRKFYFLTMLPYTSGDLHIGHWYTMVPSDARARFMRMRGFNVMYPIGFDAFGLPAENAAIERGIHPKIWTYSNIDNMRRQLRSMGASWDWSREAISADPEFYRWTQWFFLKMFERGLAYKKMSPVDWCPKDNTTLAREQVVGEDRVCHRCGTPVIKKDLEQWFFRITKYADELLDFSHIDWPEPIRRAQTNWIGRSEGARVVFQTEGGDGIPVFTTRPDTLWGATFLVLAPEHPLVVKLVEPERAAEVAEYLQQALRQSDIQRESTGVEKTGVFTGAFAVNPVNGERVPIWIADYVLMTYGTGAIMAVPAHDQRDFDFARKYGLEVRPVIQPEGEPPLDGARMTEATAGAGTMVNSGPLSGTPADQAISRTLEHVVTQGKGERAVNYRLRDWLISRQRYWGSPIPIVYCPEHGQVAVPEGQLPVLLPDDVEWLPTGESPLKLHPTWKTTTCPVCGKPAERDTDTMDTFMCSSWYHLRYLSPKYDRGPFDPKEYDYWMPVDTYTGGAEHATLHLIYTRFFHKALRDMEITDGPEPMLQLRNQGQILMGGQRMSKSRGNVADPDELVAMYGADAVRAYLMFGYRWTEGGPWSSDNIQGTVRWLHRVWSLAFAPDGGGQVNAAAEAELTRVLHHTIRQATADMEAFEFNTVISGLMELTHALQAARESGLGGTPAYHQAFDGLLRMMAPAAPHIAEEIWTRLGRPGSIHVAAWPDFDPEKLRKAQITLVVQINGKVRERLEVPADLDETEAKRRALESPLVQRHLVGAPVRQVIYVPGRLINFVV